MVPGAAVRQQSGSYGRCGRCGRERGRWVGALYEAADECGVISGVCIDCIRYIHDLFDAIALHKSMCVHCCHRP